MILCRTPYYINIPINYPTTTTDVVISLYVWSGLQASVPATANYTWTKPVPTTSTSELTVNIANAVNDFIEQTKVSASTTQRVTGANGHGVWAYYKVEYTDGTETIADITGTLFALEGYGTYLDGYNPDIPANKILLDGTEFQMSRTGSFCIGYINDGTFTTITVSEDGTLTDTLTPASSTDSDEYVHYVWLEGSDFTGDILTVVMGATTITVYLIDEGKFTTNDVMFLNKYGAQQILTFFKKNTKSLKVTSKTFNNNFVSGATYDTSKHQIKQYNKTGNRTLNMVSGFYEEENNNVFEQLLFSEGVWSLISEVFVPLNVETKTLNTKTQINDKLFGYDIDFSYAFNELNDV